MVIEKWVNGLTGPWQMRVFASGTNQEMDNILLLQIKQNLPLLRNSRCRTNKQGTHISSHGRRKQRNMVHGHVVLMQTNFRSSNNSFKILATGSIKEINSNLI